VPRNKPYDNFIPDSHSLHQMEIKGQLYALVAVLWWKELAGLQVIKS
jgi:hypothetical protein